MPVKSVPPSPDDNVNQPPSADTVARMEAASKNWKPSEKEIDQIAAGLGGAEVVQYSAAFTDDDALSIKSWSDISTLMDQYDYQAVLADEILGDGFQIMSTDDKMRLCGVPMHILDWTFHDGNLGGFVSARVIVKVGTEDTAIQKYRIADGSTGVYKDLQKVTQKLGRAHSLSVRRGLRVSEYEVEIDTKDGPKTIPAKTFYLDLSA
jgi:hypothetical protein